MYAKWIPSVEIPLLGTGNEMTCYQRPEGRNIHKFD